MTLAKGHYTVGQAYVAFSRVTQLDKLHIINYTRKQICVAQHAEKEMERLCKNTLPPMPKCFDTETNISSTFEYCKLKKQTERY